MPSFRLGNQAKIYAMIGGIGEGSWVELTKRRDITIATDLTEADVSVAASLYDLTATCGIKLSVDFEMPWDMEVAEFAELHNLAFGTSSNTCIGIRILDYAAGPGREFDAVVTKFAHAAPLRGVQMASVTVKPTLTDAGLPAAVAAE
jgi:hypothetical protein